MQCLILASGFGTRLYPLTLNKSKALLEYKGVPLINHVLNKVSRDIDLFVTTNKKFEGDFGKWLSALNRPVTLCVEPVYKQEERLGAVGSLDYCIKKQKISDDLLVLGSDNYFEFNLPAFISAFDGKTTLVAVNDIQDKDKATQFGVVRLDGNRIIEFVEKPRKPKSSLVATACWIVPARVLSLLGEFAQGGRKDNMGDFIAYLVSRDEVHAYVFNELWLDIGSTETYYNTR